MHLFETDVLKLELGSIARRLSVIDNQHINRLVDLASGTIVPKAAYRVCFVEEKQEDSVTIEAVRIQSRVLRHQLTPVGYVFPFMLTIGRGVDVLMGEMKDFLDKYIWGEIANHAL